MVLTKRREMGRMTPCYAYPNHSEDALNTMNLPSIEINERTFLRDHFALPPLPEVSTRVMQRINSGDVGPTEIANLLAADAALVALVFKLVNSAYYSLPRRIDNITQAVAFLGLSEINRLVLTVSIMQALEPESISEYKRFWRHSFYAALTSRYLARTFFRTMELEGLYSAVLLHDIGKLVYMKFFPEHYRVLNEFSQENGCFFHEAEQSHSMPSHQLFGAILCDRWGLPDSIRDACEFHELNQLEQVGPDTEDREFKIVASVSNLMAHLADGQLNDELRERVSQRIQSALECSQEDFLISMGEIYELQDSVDSFLNQL